MTFYGKIYRWKHWDFNISYGFGKVKEYDNKIDAINDLINIF